MSDDFAALRESGAAKGPGAAAGRALGRLRDACAALLVRAGATPDALSWCGFACAAISGACLAFGASHVSPLAPFAHGDATRSWWPFLSALAIAASSLLDVVDGTVARRTGRANALGGLLDSALDRLSDLVLFVAIAWRFAVDQRPELVVLAMLAVGHGWQIAYLRARAEVVIAHRPVGFWQRSERLFVLGFAAAFGTVPAALWVLGTLPALTAWRRFRQVRALLAEEGERASPRWALWRHPRGSLGYDAVAAIVLAWLLLGGRLTS